jgi:hypothetical protein
VAALSALSSRAPTRGAPTIENARIAARDGLESARKSRIEIDKLAGNPVLTVEEVILMAASDRRADASQAWAMRAERARRIATMLSVKDAEAIEAYARECEARARQAVGRQAVPPLAA